jgi:hypothetical protein
MAHICQLADVARDPVATHNTPEHNADIMIRTTPRGSRLQLVREHATQLTVIRAVSCSVVTFALLWQLVLAPPLAMLMLASPSLPGWSVALCTAGSTDRPSLPAHAPGLPAAPHNHDSCPLCQCHAAPLGLINVTILLPAAATHWQPLQWASTATSAPEQQFRLYSSRAPPFAA